MTCVSFSSGPQVKHTRGDPERIEVAARKYYPPGFRPELYSESNSNHVSEREWAPAEKHHVERHARKYYPPGFKEWFDRTHKDGLHPNKPGANGSHRRSDAGSGLSQLLNQVAETLHRFISS